MIEKIVYFFSRQSRSFLIIAGLVECAAGSDCEDVMVLFLQMKIEGNGLISPKIIRSLKNHFGWF
ncbi:MAG: hypothetical protein A2252_04625 [Elusimicrobia bacterium RIFOXYA2_FULL_39_19]|nr:MAG: hypothetical protein A2252_04625 [Elusimicrobia bacterium RIFOXYA2_FULL_39_19]